MQQHAAQPSYIDLSDNTSIRYGTECVICGARYVSEHFDVATLTASGENVVSAHRNLLDTFSEAFQEVCAVCYRCHRAACPDCWDSDHRMCGECVQRRGLARTPYRGQPTSGPFADGRISRISPGRYSDIARPEWLDHLIANDSRPDATNGASPLPPVLPSVNTGEPTHILDPSAALHSQREQASAGTRFQTTEGAVTSNTVTCPRCGTQNFDFVTNCVECQLQLIQICPVCERLNSGQAVACDVCGAPLARPQGYSQVYPAVEPNDAQAQEQANGSGLARSTYPPVTPRSGKRSSGPRSNPGASAPHFSEGDAPSHVPSPLSEPNSTNLWDVEPQPYVPGGVEPVAASEPQPQMPRPRHTLRERLTYGMESLSTLALWLVVFVIIAAVISAELSPGANAFIRTVIHVDVRQLLQGILTHVSDSIKSGRLR